MFGKNKIEKQEITDGETLKVVSIFPTIQGEGPWAGSPAIFIRLGGCNLRCNFCDTDFETNVLSLTIGNIMDEVQRLKAYEINCKLIVITGGEPLLQNIVPLITYLLANSFRVQIETAGTVWMPGLEQFMSDVPFGSPVSIVVSPKTGKVNENISKYADAWKYVVRKDQVSDYDGLPIVSYQFNTHGLCACTMARPPDRMFPEGIWVQPCDEHDTALTEENVQLAVELCMTYGYHLSLQQHKIIGVE